MLQTTLIGNLGADAQYQEKDGSKFVTFRVAHNETWTDQAGQRHETSQWIDCILNDHPKVAEYLKAGTLVYIAGNLKTRVYSSAKDRCMKAGLTINVRNIELLGGKGDPIPSQLVDDSGLLHRVDKYFHTDVASCVLHSVRGGDFQVDENGWIIPPGTTAESLDQQTNAAETTKSEPASTTKKENANG